MESHAIQAVRAREILDCRLDPTLRVTVETGHGRGRADVPVGRSTGRHEALERRDGDDRYGGRGVREAARSIETDVAAELVGMDARDQRAVDQALCALDGTAQKERLGGNVTTGVSLATLRAGARCRGVSLFRHLDPEANTLPYPVFDMIEGGELAATDLDFQEHQLVPVGAPSFGEAVRMSAEVYAELGDVLAARYGRGARNVGVEGGYTPQGLTDPRDAFDALLDAAAAAGYADEFVLSVDAAATHFFDPASETYDLLGERHSTAELIDVYADLVATYPLESIEDPLAEDDLDGTATLTDRLDVQVVGDDLFTTNPARLRRGIDAGAANALLLKVNQVGTVTEAREAAELAASNGYHVQVSERSGQTPDTWLADLAVGLGAGQIKTGVTRGERTEQYNRLFEIEDALDDPTFGAWP